MTTQLTDHLSSALDATGQLVTAVSDEQWTAPTPCSEWNVGDLVRHVTVGNYNYASILRGEPPAAPQEIPTGRDLASAYRDSAAAVLEAFRQPGILERTFTVPFGTVPGIVALHLRVTEILVHGWDLARAIGQPTRFPDHIAEQELAFTRQRLGDIPAGRSPFAPPQPVPDEAPAIDRLAACLGRNPSAERTISGPTS